MGAPRQPAEAVTLVMHPRAGEPSWFDLPPRATLRSGPHTGRLLIVSNRLPFTVRLDDGTPMLSPSCGGLATALRGIHARGDTMWIGWSGISANVSPETQAEIDRRLMGVGAKAVPLDAAEIEAFYRRYSNGALWPALHDRTDLARVDDADWAVYRAVNERFATMIAGELRPGDRVWIHDYHLMLVPRLLRELSLTSLIGFFLHTPLPAIEQWRVIPQSGTLLEGLLGADLIGFQTDGAEAHFVQSVTSLLGRDATAHQVMDGDRCVRTRTCPISVDFAALNARAADPAVVSCAAQRRRPHEALFLGIDRLDYTKGIPERLRAFGELLEQQPDIRGRVRLFQLAVPSREDVPEYAALRTEVEGLVTALNRRFSDGRWTPVEYVYGAVDVATLAALYRAADVMLVTSLRDGMNLVSKEFIASRGDGNGVLVLSRHAGAAAELGAAALLVDPADTQELVGAYLAALTMTSVERRVRMRRLRATVRRHDVHQWARMCLMALGDDRTHAIGLTAG
jgi:trehalose 6-phosphate synthase/phosphatase